MLKKFKIQIQANLCILASTLANSQISDTELPKSHEDMECLKQILAFAKLNIFMVLLHTTLASRFSNSSTNHEFTYLVPKILYPTLDC